MNLCYLLLLLIKHTLQFNRISIKSQKMIQPSSLQISLNLKDLMLISISLSLLVFILLRLSLTRLSQRLQSFLISSFYLVGFVNFKVPNKSLVLINFTPESYFNALLLSSVYDLKHSVKGISMLSRL